MANIGDDFLAAEDLEAVLSLLESDLLEDNAEFEKFLSTVEENVPKTSKEPEDPEFKCDQCTKVCLSKGGLTRHKNAKHSSSEEGSAASPVLPSMSVEEFTKHFHSAVSKIASDECYSEETMEQFKKLNTESLDYFVLYNHISGTIKSFRGNAEKFYPNFMKCFCVEDTPLKKFLSEDNIALLAVELSSYIILYLSDKRNDIIEFSVQESKFTEREIAVLTYISGYIFGKLYRRIYYSSKESSSKNNIHNQQRLTILLAGQLSKVDDENDQVDDARYKLVNARDRGGLWKVNSDVINIFKVAEIKFKQATKFFKRRIDSKKIVSDLLCEIEILSSFSNIRQSAAIKTKKEMAMNILEDALMLYIRVRTFSFVKDLKAQHQLANSQKKSRSLRTEIKRSTCTLEKGH